MNEERVFLSVVIPVHPYFISSVKTPADAYYDKILSALDKPLILTQPALSMGYRGISRKLKNVVETLLSKGRIKSAIIDGDIKYTRR